MSGYVFQVGERYMQRSGDYVNVDGVIHPKDYAGSRWEGHGPVVRVSGGDVGWRLQIGGRYLPEYPGVDAAQDLCDLMPPEADPEPQRERIYPAWDRLTDEDRDHILHGILEQMNLRAVRASNGGHPEVIVEKDE